MSVSTGWSAARSVHSRTFCSNCVRVRGSSTVVPRRAVPCSPEEEQGPGTCVCQLVSADVLQAGVRDSLASESRESVSVLLASWQQGRRMRGVGREC